MRSKEIATYLSSCLLGEDIEIEGFSSLNGIVDNTVVFAKKYSDAMAETINTHNVLAIVCPPYNGKLKGSHIIVDNPRLAFACVVNSFFSQREDFSIHPTAVIEEGAVIEMPVSIGANCYIGPNVKIGAKSVIRPNVSIYGDVSIGKNCYFDSGVIIGGEGFGFEFDEEDVPIHFPHTGKIIIGNNVFLGSNTTVAKATIDSTIIEDNVKIDSLVVVAHNCKIGKNTLITGGATLGGGVQIGENGWVAPNSAIYQQIKIGTKSKIGIGAVVLRNVKDGTTVFGNPARLMKL